MARKLTLDALDVLDAIDAKGSYAAAAAALYRVPSAVSYTVQKLEEDLGLVLFRKAGRRSELTPAGRHLIQQGRELLSAADKLVESTKQVNDGWESVLNITVDTLFDFDVIYPHMEKLYELKPDIEINLYEEVLSGTWEMLVEDKADLIIGAGATELGHNSLGVCCAPYHCVSWEFVVAKGHPLCEIEKGLTQEDICQYRAIVVKDSSRNLPAMNHLVFEKQSVLRVATLQHKLEAQLRGLGVGFLPCHQVKPYLESGELVALPFGGEVTCYNTRMAWKSNNKGKALRWFIDAIKNEVAG